MTNYITNAIEKAKIIAIDFDGTLVTENFPGIGELNVKLVEDMKNWHKQGKTLLIWTCRVGKYAKECRDFLDKHKVPYDYFNENSKESLELYQADSRKLTADLYIRSEEHTSELQSRQYLVCRLLLEKKT